MAYTMRADPDLLSRSHNAQICYCDEPNCVGTIGGKTQTDLGGMDDLYIDGEQCHSASPLLPTDHQHDISPWNCGRRGSLGAQGHQEKEGTEVG
jgi:hypothetical protein